MNMNVKLLKRSDVSYLDPILLKSTGGLVKPVSANDLKATDQDHLMQWCVSNAIYQILTTELIDWLREKIGNRSAIEICAGKSGIGRALNVQPTDSWQQTRPEIIAYYRLLRQNPIFPPGYVEKIDANTAVKKYNPDVVFGSFVTQRWRNENDKDGNMWGPLEEEWVESGTMYIHIGNEVTHKNKRILNLPHETFHFPWLRSRAIDQSKNVIWVWN